MDETLKQKLLTLGLNEEQITKLAAEGVQTDADLALLNVGEIREVTGCVLVVAKKIHMAFAPVGIAPTVLLTETSTPADTVIPEGTNPSPAQVTNFATSVGIDPNMLSMFMFAGMAGGTGMDMDLSGMLPIPQIVVGYNPKLRNMPYMIMGQLEKRLGSPIVVINADGSVNPELTVQYVMDLEEGREPADNNIYYDSTGAPYEIIRVGVDAQSINDSDPLVPSRPLAKNGMGVGRVNWSGVNPDVRQVVFFAATRTHELDPNNDAHMSWLRDHIKPMANRLVLQGQCPKAIGEYNEAARTGSLPNLRVMLTRGPRKSEVMPRRRAGSPRDLTGLGKSREESGPDSDDRFRS